MATFYKWPEAHGLPSLSPACIQVEAYIRMTGQPFVIQSCSTTTRSPTGQLPTLEVETQFPKPEQTEFAAARSCILLARKALKDLDAQLTSGLQAEVLAFTALVEQKLDAATEHSTWVEPKGYKAHVQVAYAHQPFPLNYVMPWNARREVLRRCGERDGEAVYGEAVAALAALADKLRAVAATGPYLLGAKPCSLDALVFGHLLFYRSSPCAAPALQSAVSGHPGLQQYVQYILNTYFTTPVPTVQQPGSLPQPTPRTSGAGAGSTGGAAGASGAQGEGTSSSTEWSNAAKGEKKPAKTPELSALEREFRRKSWWWLGGAAAVVLGYIVLSGRYINIDQLVQVLNQAQDDDDEGDDDDDHDVGPDDRED